MDPRSPVFNLVTVLGQLARHEAGYPIGGSLPFARAIEGRLRNLGGKVHYNARVTRIAVEAGRAIGIDLEGGTRQRADFVVGAGDLRAQLDVLLEGRFRSPAHERLFREAALCVPCVQISFGLDRRFSSGQYVVSNQLELEEPIPFPGGPLRWIHWSCHDHDPTLAPPGGSVVTCILPTEFDAWSELGREASAYREAKTSVASAAAQALEGPMPGFSRAVRTVDVATPLTVRRYTGNFRGSYMTWLGPVQREIIPKNVPGLDRFLMAGMWVSAPGGLPSAVKSGRDAVDVLRHSVPR